MKDIYKILDSLSVRYEEHKHPPVYTCEEADKYFSDAVGARCKNLFLRNKKGDRHYLVTMENKKQLDLKNLEILLNESRLSLASPERLDKYLGLTPGSVSIFGLINDGNKEVVLIMDNDLLKYDFLHYHPNKNTSTLTVSKEGVIKFLEFCGNKILFFDL